MDMFLNNEYIQSFFIGVSAYISIMIINSMIGFGKKTLKDKKYIIIFIITIVLEMVTDLFSMYFIIVFGLLGAVYNLWLKYKIENKM